MKTGIYIFIITIFIIITGYIVFNTVEEHLNMNDPTLNILRRKLDNICDVMYYRGGEEICKKLQDIKILKSNQSYTINKHKVHMCLYDENGKTYDENLLMYVFLHECAHCINETVGHDELFDEKFQYLLQMATIAGEYDPKLPIDTNYCKHGSE